MKFDLRVWIDNDTETYYIATDDLHFLEYVLEYFTEEEINDIKQK